MALTSNHWLTFDWFVVLLFCIWLSAFYPFILLNSQEEIDLEHQEELLGFGISFMCFLVYGGIAHKNGRHVILWNSIVELWNFQRSTVQRLMCLSSYCFPRFLLKPIKYLQQFVSSSSVCYCGNLILDCLIYFTLVVLLLMTFCTLMYGTPSYIFYFQNSVLELLYIACSSVTFGQEYTASRLINHVSYICLHVGYVCENLEYEKSYFAIHTGLVVFLLNIIWRLLNPFGDRSQRDSPSDEGQSHGFSPDNPPPDDDAPDESPHDDTRRPWKKPQRKSSKSEKNKSKGKKR